MERRDFVMLCAAGAALATAQRGVLAGADGQAARTYTRTLLVDPEGNPLKARRLLTDRNYLFYYPYEGTPCFLLNLGRPVRQGAPLKTDDGRGYNWEGGVGPNRAIVSYSAICAHKLAYPTKQISFISYRGSAVGKDSRATPNMIHCCAEHSEYDPAAGGKVTAGPAKQPLASILLDYDAATDELFAFGTLGGELFDEFFAKYDFKLAMEHGATKARRPVGGTAVVRDLTHFCQQEVKC
jgi:Rieske Fe-S protein